MKSENRTGETMQSASVVVTKNNNVEKLITVIGTAEGYVARGFKARSIDEAVEDEFWKECRRLNPELSETWEDEDVNGYELNGVRIEIVWPQSVIG